MWSELHCKKKTPGRGRWPANCHTYITMYDELQIVEDGTLEAQVFKIQAKRQPSISQNF